MRRITVWFAVTVTVVVLLLGYHTSRNRAVGGSTGGTVPGLSSGRGPGATSTRTQHSGSSTSRAPDHAHHRHSGAGTGHSRGSAKKPAKTYIGQTVQTARGPVEVSVRVRSGKIIRVAVPVHPGGDPRSQQINGYAVPLLVHETVSAQSNKIDMISGATITSEGYLNSLQSALDKAGI